MVWYVPPLSPVQSAIEGGHVGMNGVIPDLKSLRIPMKYLANLLTAGDEEPVVNALERMLAMRAFKRSEQVDQVEDLAVLEQVGMNKYQVEDMYQTMAIANYEDRFVIPSSHKAFVGDAYATKGGCGFSFGNGCATGSGDTNLFGGKSDTKREVIPVNIIEPVK